MRLVAKGDIHGVNEGIFRCFAKVKAIKLSDDVLMKSTGFEEMNQIFVEMGCWLLGAILFR